MWKNWDPVSRSRSTPWAGTFRQEHMHTDSQGSGEPVLDVKALSESSTSWGQEEPSNLFSLLEDIITALSTSTLCFSEFSLSFEPNSGYTRFSENCALHSFKALLCWYEGLTHWSTPPA